jgi:hypothetical protein
MLASGKGPARGSRRRHPPGRVFPPQCYGNRNANFVSHSKDLHQFGRSLCCAASYQGMVYRIPGTMMPPRWPGMTEPYRSAKRREGVEPSLDLTRDAGGDVYAPALANPRRPCGRAAKYLTCCASHERIPCSVIEALPRLLPMSERRVGLWLIGAFGGVGTTVAMGMPENHEFDFD